MIQVFRTLPKDLVVAVSGGVDSMFALHWLKSKGHNVKIAHYVHQSENANVELEFVKSISEQYAFDLIVDYQKEERKSQSKEAYWRQGRYNFFKSFSETVVVGHTLNDAAEWYLYSVMNGKISFMEYSHSNIVRPFLLQQKEDLIKWMNDNEFAWIEDSTNSQEDFAKRNKVRHKLIPVALEINPGLFNMVKKAIVEKERRVKAVGNS